MKSPRNMVTRIEESKKIEPWCKRFFLFIHNQEVQCNWSDIQRWNKAASRSKTVMAQKPRSSQKRYIAICSFVVVAGRQLPQLQGNADKALSSLNVSIKKCGEILWFIVLENKLFVILNVFNATKLLRDIKTRQIHNRVIESIGKDLGRTNPRFKGIDSLVVTFCPSDILEIESKSNVDDSSQNLPTKLNVEVSSQNEETHEEKIAPSIVNQPEIVVSKHEKLSVNRKESQIIHEVESGPSVVNQPEIVVSKDEKLSVHRVESQTTHEEKIAPSNVNHPENVVSKDEKPSVNRQDSQIGKPAPFTRNQPVEVFSKTSGQWVKAHAVCVQQDNEGIFVTVIRIDGHELDYDIENVRAVMALSNESDNSHLVPEDDDFRERITYSPNESVERDDFVIDSDPESEYAEKENAQPKRDVAARESFIPEQQQLSPGILSDADLFKRIETFYVLDKIRTIKRWLYKRSEEKEQLPEMISEKLQEVSDIVKTCDYGL